MKHVLLQAIAGVGLLGFAVAPGAQAQRPRDDDAYHRDRDDYYRGGERWRARMFERIRMDLDHVQASTFPLGRDEYRIAQTKRELNELQDKLATSRYDQPELDQAIAALQRVVSDNRLSDRDREILNDDLTRMRQFRERHSEWGVR